jgi:hypothetical protein
MSLHVSETYSQLIDKARWSHAHGRNVAHILSPDIQAARLFSYAFRAQTIGAFHAARVTLQGEACSQAAAYAADLLHQACLVLERLEAKAVDPVCADHRALISTLYSYDQAIHQVHELLGKAAAYGAHPQLATVHSLFRSNMERVTAGNGLYIARDLQLPEQGAFIVPDLDISIAPLVYGDYHSWNAAFLAGNRPGVAVHRHHFGAEIHLGYSPVKGRTILGDCCSEVDEGYAMPIPPMTDHGFLNTSGEDHVLPFVFGSLGAGGWGVFFDVEARPGEKAEREEKLLESAEMNQSVFLERAIQRMKAAGGPMREVLVPAHRAGSAETGGLELAITCGAQDSIELLSANYRIVSVQSGQARVQVGNAEATISHHDHFGIPANMDCRLTPSGAEPLVFLDAMILPLG